MKRRWIGSEAWSRLVERRKELLALERRIARDSGMPGGFYEMAVADHPRMIAYGDSPNLRRHSSPIARGLAPVVASP